MKRIRMPKWGWMFLVIPYFKPAVLGVLEGTELLETAFDIWRLMAAAVILGLYVYQMVSQRRRPSGVLVGMCVYLGFIALSTLIRQDTLWSIANYVVTILTFCMLLELSLRDGPETTMDMLVLPLTVLVLANFILMCIYPTALCTGGAYNYRYNFLGIDNFLAPILVPYMFMVALRSTMRTGGLDFFAYAMMVVCALSIMLIWAATGLMGMAVALIFLLCFYQRKLQTLFNFSTTMLLAFGLFYCVVVFRLQDLFAFFIEGVLHKGLSFTGRTDIWDEAIRMFLLSPLLGYGYTSTGKVYRLVKGKYYHAHNAFLEILVEGGLGAMMGYLFMLERAGKQLMIYRRHDYACLISAGLMASFLMMSMESYLDSNGLLVYALIFLGYHVGTLICGKETAPAGGAKALTMQEGEAPKEEET